MSTASFFVSSTAARDYSAIFHFARIASYSGVATNLGGEGRDGRRNRFIKWLQGSIVGVVKNGNGLLYPNRFSRLLSAGWEIPRRREAMDWLPSARRIASFISCRAATSRVGSVVSSANSCSEVSSRFTCS